MFGDNDLRAGFGGAAKELRGEPNTIGVRVKKKPSSTPDSYYTDLEFIQNKQKIDADIQAIKNQAINYRHLCILHGIGSGLAELNIRAPRTYAYLLDQLYVKLSDWADNVGLKQDSISLSEANMKYKSKFKKGDYVMVYVWTKYIQGKIIKIRKNYSLSYIVRFDDGHVDGAFHENELIKIDEPFTEPTL